VFGAPEMVLADRPHDDGTRRRADELAAEGQRVLVLARTEGSLDGDDLPDNLAPVALVLLDEKVRSDAAETLSYFADQGVALKVISGDNPRTVGAVARRVGLPGAEEPVDARELPDDQEALAEMLEEHSVFGRVTPQQKRAMVGALQSKGHVVAMTGDGVNDALALKDADIGIAMGSGAAATRAVAQLVLLDGRFATMPGVVAEGRRVIANIERSANLFVTKTVYAILIAVAVVLTSWRYPFLPRHLTLVSTFSIGIPGFFLALAPNRRRYVPGFLQRVLRFCVPAGLVAAVASMSTYAVARFEEDLVLREARTTTALVLVAVGLWVLVILARPFTWWKTVLVGAMAGSVALTLAMKWSRKYFDLKLPDWRVIGEAALIAAGAILVLEIGWRTSRVVGRRRFDQEAEPDAPEPAAAR
jgi:cation-transporting ATPase E